MYRFPGRRSHHVHSCASCYDSSSAQTVGAVTYKRYRYHCILYCVYDGPINCCNFAFGPVGSGCIRVNSYFQIISTFLLVMSTSEPKDIHWKGQSRIDKACHWCTKKEQPGAARFQACSKCKEVCKTSEAS